MKIALFVGELNAQGLELLAFIGQHGFSCIKTQNPDEIDQTGQQSSRAILIFNDPKFAFRFLVENKWPAFPTLNILYLPQRPKITPEVEQKLQQVHLTIYTPSDNIMLLEKMEEFQVSVDNEDSLIDSLEFSVNEKLGKKP